MIIDKLKAQGIPPNEAERLSVEKHWLPLAEFKWYQLQRLSHTLDVGNGSGFISARTRSDVDIISPVHTELNFHKPSGRFNDDGDAFLIGLAQSNANTHPDVCAEIRFNRFNRSVQSAVRAATTDASETGIISAEVVYAQDYGESGHAHSLSAVRLEVTANVIEQLRQTGLHLPDEKNSYIEAVVVDRDLEPDYYVSSPGESSRHTHKVDVQTLLAAGIQIPEIQFKTDSVSMLLNDLELGIDATNIEFPAEKIASNSFIFPLHAKRGQVNLLEASDTAV